MPSFGNSQCAMNAPTMPMMMSPISPKPAPRTIRPASQPATARTTSTMRMASPDMQFPWLPHNAPERQKLQFRRRGWPLSAGVVAAFHDPDQVGHDAVQLQTLRRVDSGDASRFK